jgi:ribonuclease P protein component
MFSRKNRLAKDRDVQRVVKAGRAFFDPRFTIKALRQPEHTRITVVVSTKVSKSAVRRNRIKRVLREYLRKQVPHLVPADYMIIVRPKVALFTAAQLLASIEGALLRNKLLRKS